MTRGKWVALAVGVAVIAVLVPYGPAIWEMIAYREAEVQEAPNLEGYRGLIMSAVTDQLDQEFIKIAGPAMRQARVKRWSWLPGRQVVLRDERCWACVGDSHRYCPGRIAFSAKHRDLPCTCTHPSHVLDSK